MIRTATCLCVLRSIDIVLFQYENLTTLHLNPTAERGASHYEMKCGIEKTDDGMASLKITGKSHFQALKTLFLNVS